MPALKTCSTAGIPVRRARVAPNPARSGRRWMCAPRKLGTEIVEWLSIHGAPIPGLAAKAVHTHALELGLEDAPPLRRSFRRLFDTSPSTVKQTIGWEWLAERWWVRHRSIRP